MLEAAVPAIGNLIGGLLGKKAEKKERQMQVAFAQNGIQWKVADAEKAGVHPLFALGAPTASYSPISTGAMGNAVANMGQDLGRAAASLKTPEQKVSAYDARLRALQLERGTLENTLLRNQIINEQRVAGQPPTRPGNPTAALIPGQGDSRRLEVGGLRVTPKPTDSQAQDWENEYGEIADLIGAGRLISDVNKPLAEKWYEYVRKNPWAAFMDPAFLGDDLNRYLRGRQRRHYGKSDRERR